MARECIFCKRSSHKAVSRSHSNIGTIHRQRVNLQNRWIDGTQVKTCTNCLKIVKEKTPHLFKKVARPLETAKPKTNAKKK